MKALVAADLRCPTTGKAAFASRDTAEEWVRRRVDGLEPNANGRTPARVYRCHDCGWYHLTASPGAAREAAA